MKLIVGLGNPGKEYEMTRHNSGFCVLDAIAEECRVDVTQKKFKEIGRASCRERVLWHV